MIATLVIGLREGLEAALIVGIIAAFLKRNGRPLTSMWIGVVAAVIASLAVGIGLSALESALPQSAQEALETVIGAVAVVFVTGMLLWMNTHARTMKKELEASATEALHDGTAWALAAMAFLAVLKEGFETSVFLLATFQASTNTTEAAIGAVIGVVLAIGVGIGIYAGGVRINLGRFFRITSGFLVLVAAGLVLTAIRTAHEAGWLNAGQQQTVDLGWLAPNGSVQGALITGMLGIPSDPRLIEVVAWFAYLIPVALLVYLPARFRPVGAAAIRMRWVIAAGLGVAALVLVVAIPGVPQPKNATVTLLGSNGSGVGSAHLNGSALTTVVGGRSTTTRLAGSGHDATLDGVLAVERTTTGTQSATGPASITLDELVAASGGRLPVGLNADADPGPFTADWSASTTRSVWTADGVLLDARQQATTILTLSGGGLGTSRTVSVTSAQLAAAGLGGTVATDAWRADPATVSATARTITDGVAAAPERRLWSLEVPIVLLLAALVLAATTLRLRRRSSTRPTAPLVTPSPSLARSSTYAAK